MNDKINVDVLVRCKKMLDEGLISQDEFDEIKNSALNFDLSGNKNSDSVILDNQTQTISDKTSNEHSNNSGMWIVKLVIALIVLSFLILIIGGIAEISVLSEMFNSIE